MKELKCVQRRNKKAVELQGVRFHKLLVLEKIGRTKHSHVLWACLCNCGKKSNVTTQKLRSGNTKSCGCLKREKMAFNVGSNNGLWTGDRVGLDGLHTWVKRRLTKPTFCEECKKVPPYDLANRTGKYLRELSDWRFLCRRCHMLSDGRMKNLRQYHV